MDVIKLQAIQKHLGEEEAKAIADCVETCKRQAMAYAAEHDETPIDAEWIKAMKPISSDVDYRGTWWFDFGPCEVFESLGCDNTWVVENDVGDRFTCSTRGQLLAAMRLMGVKS